MSVSGLLSRSSTINADDLPAHLGIKLNRDILRREQRTVFDSIVEIKGLDKFDNAQVLQLAYAARKRTIEVYNSKKYLLRRYFNRNQTFNGCPDVTTTFVSGNLAHFSTSVKGREYVDGNKETIFDHKCPGFAAMAINQLQGEHGNNSHRTGPSCGEPFAVQAYDKHSQKQGLAPCTPFTNARIVTIGENEDDKVTKIRAPCQGSKAEKQVCGKALSQHTETRLTAQLLAAIKAESANAYENNKAAEYALTGIDEFVTKFRGREVSEEQLDSFVKKTFKDTKLKVVGEKPAAMDVDFKAISGPLRGISKSIRSSLGKNPVQGSATNAIKANDASARAVPRAWGCKQFIDRLNDLSPDKVVEIVSVTKPDTSLVIEKGDILLLGGSELWMSKTEEYVEMLIEWWCNVYKWAWR